MEQNQERSALVAEFIGSMLLVAGAVGSMTFLTWVYELPTGMALIGNAISVGFILFALIEIFGPLSGAHFNPVVTLVMTLEEKTPWRKFFLYVAVQLMGGIVGTQVVHLMFWQHFNGLLFISENVRDGGRYFSEVFATFVLVLGILIMVKNRSKNIPMAVGLLVGGQILATSSTIFANPMVSIARIFTSAVSGIRPSDALIFIIMQFAGGLLAFATYKFMFAKQGNKHKGEMTHE